MKVLFIVLLVLSLLISGCKEEDRTGKQSDETPTEQVQVSSEGGGVSGSSEVDSASTATPQYTSIFDYDAGEEVTLEGQFWGWGGSKADCMNELNSPPVSRSDWILKVGDGNCVYVTGSIPEGVDKLAPKGEMVTITGIIKQLDSGQLYIEKK